MSIRKILVPLSGRDGDSLALNAAARLAVRFQANIVGLHVAASGDAALPFLGDTASGAVIEDILDRIEEEAKKSAEKAASEFKKWHSVTSLPDDCDASCVQATGDRDAILASHARCSDLIVACAPRSEDDAGLAADIEAVLMGSGRPVLLVPDKVGDEFASKAIVAWNDSIESARALFAATPLLETADSVTVAAVRVHVEDSPDLAPVVDLLKAHGATADSTVIDAADREISDVLIEHARRHKGTVLIMGAYSHSRLKEQVFGGVTQDVLDFTEVPVLLIH